MTAKEFVERYKGFRVRVNDSWRLNGTDVKRNNALIGSIAVVCDLGVPNLGVVVELEVSQNQNSARDLRYLDYTELDLIDKPKTEPLPLPG
jgi:hypothetical protein